MRHTAARLQELIDTYFQTCKAEATHPTPAGFALWIDYDTTTQLITAVKNDPPDPKMDEETLRFLRRGVTRLEQYYTENGLKDLLPSAFTKLMLSAYFDINEKSVKKEEHDQTITIIWEGETPPGLPSPAPEVIEADFTELTEDIPL